VFGDDGLDPAYMEGRDGKLVDFAHILNQVQNTQKLCNLNYFYKYFFSEKMKSLCLAGIFMNWIEMMSREKFGIDY
jgi:hypothetical protein